jgi:predicted methyltransferase
VIRVTEVAHAAVRAVLQAGEAAIDATAGNGHDTRFLCECVGPGGRVFAFDIQPEARARTAALVGNATNVMLLPIDHAAMREAIPSEYRGRIGVIMFNLGYLPGGNKAVRTQTESTVRAVNASLELLRPGGVLTILAYTGHPGGTEEADAVHHLLNDLPTLMFEVREVRCERDSMTAPRLFVVHKATLTG